jgi:hypothetical protein
MPGELFVEYQLAAKAMRPDLFVTMAAYGDYGPDTYQQQKPLRRVDMRPEHHVLPQKQKMC